MKNYYNYFDNLSTSELLEELNIVENYKIDTTGNTDIDNAYIQALYDYLEDNGIFE